ncbi:MAG: hypothetical protein U5O39_07950 [Gammaproteobacteria bacterium]|nr:hypothetical protein [Gammaproteobacteria bacterium]
MAAPRIRSARVAAAHDGVAELVLFIEYDTGGVSEIVLDEIASRALMDSTGAQTVDDLAGQSWEHVRDALAASWNRFQ